MAKLTVKNVGPIREAELEVKKHTVFIGPQGSGKSTLAKLISICSDKELTLSRNHVAYYFEKKYNLDGFFEEDTQLSFLGEVYTISFNEQFEVHFNDPKQEVDIDAENLVEEIESLAREAVHINNKRLLLEKFFSLQNKFQHQVLKEYESTYIPAERILISTLSNSIWGIINANISLPKTLTAFSEDYENARGNLLSMQIPFLGIGYFYEQSHDKLITETKKTIGLAQSASGYQSIIPLLLVVEHQRQQSRHRFIIEEPELNLYPTAQKDLIYSLMGGLQPDVEYQDAEWVITTHSPYVLSSFNTLMLAYKVAQRSDELRAEVEKIIPSRCWINPDEFAAYYVDNGTVRSIISEKTGLIADNELDDVSEDLAGEQDQLLELSRSVPRA